MGGADMKEWQWNPRLAVGGLQLLVLIPGSNPWGKKITHMYFVPKRNTISDSSLFFSLKSLFLGQAHLFKQISIAYEGFPKT